MADFDYTQCLGQKGADGEHIRKPTRFAQTHAPVPRLRPFPTVVNLKDGFYCVLPTGIARLEESERAALEEAKKALLKPVKATARASTSEESKGEGE